MSFIVVIPARYASSRLPGKPLLDIAGKSMIQRVYEQVAQVQAERIIVATDHADIKNKVLSFGGDVVMTKKEHPSGTDRVNDVCHQLNIGDDKIIINVQGDEPFIPPDNIQQLAALFNKPDAQMATLCCAIKTEKELKDPNVVKVVMSQEVAGQSKALYFSRSVIPFPRNQTIDYLNNQHYFRHLGIYAYRRDFLNRMANMPPSRLEMMESLEQLRVLEAGYRIDIDIAKDTPEKGVDTHDDWLDAKKIAISRFNL